MKFVTKNFLVKEMGFTGSELDILVSKRPEIEYTAKGKTQYNIELVADSVKEDEIKKVLGLGTSREIYDFANKKMILPVKGEDYFKTVSDLLGKYNKTKRFGINTTINHSETTNRQINHRLYRIEKSLNFLKDFYSDKVEQKKVREAIQVKEVKANAYTSDEVDSLIRMVGKEVDEIRTNYAARLSVLETRDIERKSKISSLEEQIEELKGMQNTVSVPNNTLNVDDYKFNKEGYRKMYPDELTKAKYVVDNMDKVYNLSESQRNCLESIKSQYYGTNGMNVRVTQAGLGIVRDCYSRLIENGTHTNGGCN